MQYWFLGAVFLFTSVGCDSQKEAEPFEIDYSFFWEGRYEELELGDLHVSNSGTIYLVGAAERVFANPIVLSFDPQGNAIFPDTTKESGAIPGTRATNVVEAIDGKLLVCGFYNTEEEDDRHLGDRSQAVFITKLDLDNKKIEWSKQIPSGYNSTPEDMIVDENGEIFILCDGMIKSELKVPESAYSMDYPTQYPRIIQLSNEGEVINDALVGEPFYSGFGSALCSYNTDIYVLSTVSGNYLERHEIQLTHINENLRAKWMKQFQYKKGADKNFNDQHWGVGLESFSTGELLILGVNEHNAEDKDHRLIKVDSEGNEIWTKNFSGGTLDPPSMWIDVNDDIYLAGENNDDEFYLIKLDADGNELFHETRLFDEHFEVIGVSGSWYDNGVVVALNLLREMEGDFYSHKVDYLKLMKYTTDGKLE